MFLEETKEEWDRINQMEDSETKEREVEKFQESVRKRKAYWEKLKVELQELIDERNDFVTTQSLYPRDYASMITTMEVSMENLEEYIQYNPLKKDKKIEMMIVEERGKVQRFVALKEDVLALMPRIEAYTKRLDEDEKYNVLLRKQDLFLCFQNGNVDKATSLVNYFKDIV